MRWSWKKTQSDTRFENHNQTQTQRHWTDKQAGTQTNRHMRAHTHTDAYTYTDTDTDTHRHILTHTSQPRMQAAEKQATKLTADLSALQSQS